MSEALERKIVELQFDNAEFERRVAKSMKTIESLKKELDFDESAKSLDRLEKAANDISFKGLEKETTSLGDLFDWSSIFKISLLQKVADQVIDTATRMLKSMTIDNVTAGMTKYEMKTKSVQTIMAATGKSVAEVEKVLERLNYYTDMTSYDFADMTNNIGKFTSAGIDLETAEVAMEGIANWAAVSGQEIAGASRAMYNLSQALSVGHVKLIDWKSIENANMATKEFKEYVIETAIGMGKLQRIGDKVGKTLKGTSVDFKNFSQTLSEGWFDNDVLIATLTQYADTNTEIGAKAYDAARKALTFTQAMQAVRDSISTGWMKTWQLLFGDVEEAGTFFTNLCDSIIEVTERIDEARNNLLQEWRDFTSIFTDDKGNHYKGKDMATLIFHTVWDTIVSVGAAISRAMEMVANPSSVLFGNGGFDMHGWTVAVENIEDLATGNMLGRITDGILGFVGAIREFIYGESIFGGQRIVKLVHIFTGLFSILDIGRQIIGSILGFIGRIAKYLTPLVDAALEIGAALGDVFYMIDMSLRSGGLKALGDSLFEFLRPALDWLNSVGTKIKDWVLKQIEKIPDLLEKITKRITKFLDSLRKWGKRVTDVFKPILRPIEYIWSVIKGWFSGEGLENMNLWDKIQEIWKRITNTDFSKWKISFQLAFADIKNRASTLWNVIKDTVKQKWGIDLSWVDEAVSTIRQKWDAFTTWWQGTAIYKWFTEADKKTGLTGFQTVAYAIGDAFKNAWDFFTEPDADGETGFQRWKKNLLDRCNEIKLAIENWHGWKDIGKFFSSIWDWFTKRQVHGLKTDEEGNLAGWEFVGTGAEYAAFKIKNWFVQAAKDVEKWWNDDNPFAVVFRTIANGVWTGLTTIWDFFTNNETDTGKTEFQNWIDELYGHYEDIKKAVTEWKGWDDISNFFGGIWDYFTKSYKYIGDEGVVLFEGTDFQYTIYQIKQWFDTIGEEIDVWWNGDNIIRTAFETIKGWFEEIVKWFQNEAVPRDGSGTEPTFKAFFENLGTDIDNAWENATKPGTLLGDLKNKVTEIFSGIWEYFTKSYKYVGDEGVVLFEGTEFGYTVHNIIAWFDQAAKDIETWWTAPGNPFRQIWEMISEFFSGIWDLVLDKSEDENGNRSIATFLQNVLADIEGLFADDTFLGQLKNTVTGFFTGIWEAIFGKSAIQGNLPREEDVRSAYDEYVRQYMKAYTRASAGASDAAGKTAPSPMMSYEEWMDTQDVDDYTGILGFVNRIKRKLQQWYEDASPVIDPIVQFFTDLWNSIYKFFTEPIPENNNQTGWQSSLQQFVHWLDGIWTTITKWTGWQEIGKFFTDVGEAIAKFFRDIFGNSEEKAKNEVPEFDIASEFVTPVDGRASLFDPIIALVGKVGELLENTKILEFSTAGSTFEGAVTGFKNVWNFAKDIINYIIGDGNLIGIVTKTAGITILFKFMTSLISKVGTLLAEVALSKIGKWMGTDFTLRYNFDGISGMLIGIGIMIAAISIAASKFASIDEGSMWKVVVALLLLGNILPKILAGIGDIIKNKPEKQDNTTTFERLIGKLINWSGVIFTIWTVMKTILDNAGKFSEIKNPDAILKLMEGTAIIMTSVALLLPTLVASSVTFKSAGMKGLGMGLLGMLGTVGIIIAVLELLAHMDTGALDKLAEKGEKLGDAIGKTIGTLSGTVVGYFKKTEMKSTVEGLDEALPLLSQIMQKFFGPEGIQGISTEGNIADLRRAEEVTDVLGKMSSEILKWNSITEVGVLKPTVDPITNEVKAGYVDSIVAWVKATSAEFKNIDRDWQDINIYRISQGFAVFDSILDLYQLYHERFGAIWTENANGQAFGTVFSDDMEGFMAAIENFLNALATSDIAEALGEFYNDFLNGFGNLDGHVWWQSIKLNLDAGYILERPDFVAMGTATSAAIAEGITAGESLVIHSGQLLASQVLEAYYQDLRKGGYSDAQVGSVDYFSGILNQLQGGSILSFDPTTLLSKFTEIETYFGENGAMSELTAKITSGMGDFMSAFDLTTYETSDGTEGPEYSLLSGVTDGVNDNLNEIIGLVDNTYAAVSAKDSEFKTAGYNLVAGLVKGIKSGIDDATEAARFVATQVLQKFHQVWRIGSPSKETEEYGGWLVEGLYNGLVGEEPTFIGEIESFAETVGETFGNGFAIGMGAALIPVALENTLNDNRLEKKVEEAGNKITKPKEWLEQHREIAEAAEQRIKDANLLKSVEDVIDYVRTPEAPGLSDRELRELKADEYKVAELAKKQEEAKANSKGYTQMLSGIVKGIFDLADADLTYEPVIRPIIDWSNVTADVGYAGRIFSGMPALSGGTYASGTLEETMRIQNDKNNGDMYNVVVDIRDKVEQMDKDMLNMKIVLNSGILAGELVSDIDNELGMRVINNGRAN